MKYIFLFLLFFLGSSLSLLADTYEPKDVTELQAQYNLLIDLRNEESISEDIFEEKTAYLKELATEKFQMDIADLELQQIVPAQRIDWIASAFYVISALLLLIILRPLLRTLLRPIYKLYLSIKDLEMVKIFVRKFTWFFIKTREPLAYISLFFLLYFIDNEYVVLVVSFALGALISYSIYSRKGETRAEVYRTVGSWIQTILWGLIAYFYSNAFVGFLSVASFVSSIGFSFYMGSSLIALGFKKDDTPFVLRLTIFTFILSLLSWLIFYTNYIPVLSALKPHLRVFEVGMTSLIPLVTFIGLFYINYIYTFKEDPVKKVVTESIALIAALSVLIISLVYGISSMFWIGLLFTVWFSFDKFYWFVFKNAGIVISGLILSVLLAVIGYSIKSNLPAIMEYLKFLNL